jgi:hypothetical protein
MQKPSPEVREASSAGNISGAKARLKEEQLGKKEKKRAHRRREQGHLQALP